jgi:hypothetical protein
MTLALTCAAFRRRPFTVFASALLLVVLASIFGASTPIALAAWVAASLASLEGLHILEVLILQRLGYRAPTYTERERLEPALGCGHVQVLVLDAPQLWVGRGLRCLVLTRAILDVLEDRALMGLLHDTAAPVWRAALAGQVLVWVGTLPILIAWWLTRGLMLLGRLLAVAIGAALVLPLVVWPRGFVLWAGRAFGATIVSLVGAALLSSGLAAPGLALLLAWALAPGMCALLGWETRRAEAVADQATIAAGLGWQLIEALETLQETEPLPRPTGLHRLLSPGGAPLGARADRIRHALGTG